MENYSASSHPSDEDSGAGRRGKLMLSFFKYWEIPTSQNAPPPNPMWLWTESCAFKAASGILIGGGVGVAMGVFFGVLGADPAVSFGPGGRAVPQAPLKDQVLGAYRSLGEKANWYMKSFAVITGKKKIDLVPFIKPRWFIFFCAQHSSLA